LELFAADPDTEVIAAYIEGVRDGRRFLDALRRAAARKPVVVLKGGRTAAGRTAAASHTAAMASQQAVWQAAIRQAGAMEVDSLNELIDMLVAFCLAGPADGPRVAVLGGAGGETVETADLCHEAGLDVAPLPQDLREALRDKLPHAWDWVGNPVDGSILGWGRSEALDVIRLMAASPAYDLIFANARGVEHMLNQEDGDRSPQGAGEGERQGNHAGDGRTGVPGRATLEGCYGRTRGFGDGGGCHISRYREGGSSDGPLRSTSGGTQRQPLVPLEPHPTARTGDWQKSASNAPT